MIDTHSEPLSLCYGEQPDELQTLPTLADVLHQAAQTLGKTVYLHSDGTEHHQTYAQLARQARQVLSGMQGAGAQPGDRIVLQILPPADLLVGIWACWLGGFVAVPIAVPPSYTTEQSKALQLQSVLSQVNPSLVLVSQSIQAAIRDFLEGSDGRRLVRDHRVVSLESLRPASPLESQHQSNPEAISGTAAARLALILFTSGSTGKPKGVMLTEQNLLVSAYGMATVNGLTERSITLNWMPLEHVASLVMFHLTEVYLGCQQIHVSNDYILSDPLRWLDVIDRFRVTATWAPNFAYGLVNDRSADIAQRRWDLSCVQWMGNGAEAVVGKTMCIFLQLLAPHGLAGTAASPGYGMSETCSGIVHSHRFSSLVCEEAPFVEVGTSIPGVSLRIVDPQQQIVPEGVIGSLQVHGLTITPGYYERSDLNAEHFTTDGWFDTGDLGILRAKRLTITGRQKDVIVLNGVNVHSHEIEAVVEELAEVEASYTAACAVRQAGETTDKLAIFLHPAVTDIDLKTLVKIVRRQVVTRFGISPDYVIPVERAAIPKTVIGKIQRSQLSQQFQAGKFSDRLTEIATLFQPQCFTEPPLTQIEQQLLEIWQSVLGLTAIGRDEHFFELGGDSLRLVQVLHQLQQQGHTVPAVDLFQYPTIATLATFLSQPKAYPSESQAVQQGQRRAQQRQQTTSVEIASAGIAVIGMSCRFPGAASIEQFWQNLCDGVESISFFSDQEILASGVAPQLVQHPDYVKASPILEQIEGFDASFFGYSPREAELLDPQQRLMLECAWEGMEDAGYDPLTYPTTGGAIALYAGASMNTYLLNHVYPNRDRLDANDSLGVVTLSSLGGFQLTVANDKDYLTTRVSHKLNLTGPSVNVQTACSTSLVAIHLAAQALLRGECDLAIAGGVSVHTPQQVGHLYQEGMILTPDGHCRAFDAQAEGTIFGSGAGVVVLKGLEAAIADRDQIYAVIKGSAIGNDGGMKVGYLAPSAEGQSAVISEAMTMAGFSADSIGYVEAHGTGTPLGDPIEMAALNQAFRGGTDRTQFCAIGSVKTNVGHLNIASGVVGFIKTVLALHHQRIPPSLHFKTPNPQIDFAHSPFFVNTALRPWPRNETNSHPRRAGVNSLGIGGTNAHIVLQEAPPPSVESPTVERPLHLLTLSAKDSTALQELADRYAQFLSTHGDVSLADLCFTANRGRSLFSERLAIIAASPAEAQAQLRNGCNPVHTRSNGSRPEIAFLFPGQGSHYSQMGRQLYETQPIFQQAIDRCDQILQTDWGISLRQLLYGEPDSPMPDTLQQTAYAQSALFVVEYALYELWRSWGIQPSVVMGHGVGEYMAAYAAGVFSLEDALRLVMHRGRLMQAQPPGEMAAVFANVDQVGSILAQTGMGAAVAIAAINGPDNTAISGSPESIQQAVSQLHRHGIATKFLPASHSHSLIVEPVLAEFRAVADTVHYTPPTMPLISNWTGTLATDEIASADYWCQQLEQPVQFTAGRERLRQSNCDILLECGPKSVLLGLGRSLQQDSTALWLESLNPDHGDWSSLLNSLKQLYLHGVTIDWAGFDQVYPRQRISLPTYPFQRRRYWLEAPTPPLPGIAPTIHPLLGQKIATPKATLFDAQWSLDTLPFLKDHRIHGAIVVPGAAYVEMAIATGLSLLPSAPTELEMVVHQTMILSNAPQSVQTSVTQEATGLSFEIHSHKSEPSESWTLHCTGTITTDPAPPVSPDLSQLQQQFTSEISWPNVLSSLPGIEYGRAFQGVQQVWRNENAVLGRVQLPEELRTQAASYRIHPALLDACWQIVLAVAPHSVLSNANPYIPVSLDRLHYYERPSHQVWSYIEIKTQTPETLIADLTIFNDDGNQILTITGLTARAVSSQALGLTPPWLDWIYTLEWQPTPLPPGVTSLEPGHWLIFADYQGIGWQLAHRLQAQQHSCTIVAPRAHRKQGCSEQFFDQVQIDPACAGDFDRLVQFYNWGDGRRPVEDHRPLRGVIYLWGLDATEVATTATAYAGALHLAQSLIRAESQAALWLITQGSQSLNVQPSRWVQATLWGLGRTLTLEHPKVPCCCVDLDTDRGQMVDWLVAEIQSNPTAQPVPQIAFQAGARYTAQLTPYAMNESAGVSSNLQLHLSKPGSFDHLVWQSVDRRNPESDEIELRVLATGLNFRDVLNALDRYPGEPGRLGVECVGEVVAVGTSGQGFEVGDTVLAIAPGCFSRFVTVKAELAIPKPSSLSVAAAATLPTAFLTAYYALRVVANLQPGDRVLIHAAAGGVGLAAVQLAQQAGAEIFATASPPKWSQLQQRGITHVYSSRSLDFVEAIRSDTNGEGVDVVLNCLAGEFILHTASLLRPGGRFVEIGKPAAAQIQHLQQTRPDIHYVLVDLMQVTEQHPNQIQAMFRQVMEQIQQAQLQPLPHTLFCRDRIVDAFRYMQQAKQVGKVVIEFAQPASISSNGVYLITGGLGGLGLQVAEALISWGAKHLLLIGRNAPTPEAAQRVRQWQQSEIEVIIELLDIADPQAVTDCFKTHFFKSEDNSPRCLRGVFHAAGVLDDGAIENQTQERFERVMAAKIQGAWNLHLLAQTVPLDYFVLFSSAASLLGSVGQANYAAANAGLDALAHLRRSLGLPALSINWGPWAAVGMSARTQAKSRLERKGLQPIPPEVGLNVLKALLSESLPQVGVLPFTHSRSKSISTSSSTSTSVKVAPVPETWLDEIKHLPANDHASALAERIRQVVAKLLGIEPSHVEPNRGFSDLGMDSLTSTELSHKLQKHVGRPLPTTLLYNYPTLVALTDFLMQTLELYPDQNEAIALEEPGTSVEQLSEVEAEALLLDELKRLNL